jgi:transcriptional regulator with XRE-family HTH domain
MSQHPEAHWPVKTIAKRVKLVRRRRGLTAANLAERMRAAGIKWDRNIVANLETGRRENVTVSELLALGVVLNVAPIHLLIPLDTDPEPYQVTPTTAVPTGVVREWVRGRYPLPDADRREYFTEVPEKEWQAPSTPKEIHDFFTQPGLAIKYEGPPVEDQDRADG